MTLLRREERLRAERRAAQIEAALPAMKLRMRKLDAEWQAASERDDAESHAIYETKLEEARKLAEEIEADENELAEVVAELTRDDSAADHREYYRGRL